MKIVKTYSIYSIITIILAILLMILAWMFGKNDLEGQVKEEYNRVFDRYKAILELKNSTLEKTTYDYSYWDDLVTFVDTNDSQWSTTNLLPLEKTFDISHIFVLDAHKKPVFIFPEDASKLTLSLESIDANTPAFKQFFHFQDQKLYAFFLAPIHFSSDSHRTGKPQGFLLLGREWDSSFFSSIEKISLGKATFLSYETHAKSYHETHDYHIPLLSIDGTRVGCLDVIFESFLISFAEKMQNALIFVSVMTGLIVFGLLYLLTQKLIFRPIQSLSLALKTRDIRYIDALMETKNELGEMAHLMQEYEEQKALLESYKSAVDESMIVSKTDRKGVITYVNDEFIKISGFKKEELMGKSHNIVRHPDVPESFFEEMWEDLKKGLTWKGVVKNRRKNGTSYYIKTVIMPLFNQEHTIKEYIGIRHDVTEIFDQVNHFRKETITGLPRARELHEKIKHRSQSKMHLAIINICAFHDINTLYGREIGDVYLKQFALKLGGMMDSRLMLFHLHADEFALYGDVDMGDEIFLEECTTMLQQLQTKLVIENFSHEISFRMGIANGYENIYDRAENALKRAREMHKAIIVDDDVEGFEERLKNNALWNQKIRDAIAEQRFLLFFQQIVPLGKEAQSRKKYEALIRMRDEKGEILSPYIFLDIAKKLNFYDQLSCIVIEQATFMANKHQFNVSINITNDDILTPKTLQVLFACIEKYNLQGQVTLELVESEGIEDSYEVRDFLQKARKLGCLIAIDDFGSGYSNFEYLLRIAVDFIKIDGSLIKNIDKDVASRSAVQAIINFAKSFDVAVVAEYVHNEAVYNEIKSLGIDFAQGFYLHEPSSLDE